MKRLIVCILMISLLLSSCGITKDYSLEADPFAHTYRVVEILESGSVEPSLEETLLINIDALCNLYFMDDTTTYEFQEIGKLQQIELSDNDTRKGLWFCYKGSDRYELSVEADDTVVLTCLNNEDALWSYRLSRVDMISAHLSSADTRSHIQLNWYFENTFPGNLQLPNRPDILKKGTMGFSTEDDRITNLTVFEEYYTDGNVEHREYTLSNEDGFSIDLSTRYETGE